MGQHFAKLTNRRQVEFAERDVDATCQCGNAVAMRLRIRELMEDQTPVWTLEKLSEVSGLSVSVLSRLESGKRRFNQDHIVALSRAFDVEPIDLFHGRHVSRQARVLRDLFATLGQDDQALVLAHLELLSARGRGSKVAS